MTRETETETLTATRTSTLQDAGSWLAEEIARRDAETAVALRAEVARREALVASRTVPDLPTGVASHVSGLAVRLARVQAEAAEEQAARSRRG